MKILLSSSCNRPRVGNLSTDKPAPAQPPIVLHAAQLLDVAAGKLISPGEVLVNGDRITEVGTTSPTPQEQRSSTSATQP